MKKSNPNITTFCSDRSVAPCLWEQPARNGRFYFYFRKSEAYGRKGFHARSLAGSKLFVMQEHTFVQTLPASGEQEPMNRKRISAKFVTGSLLNSRACRANRSVESTIVAETIDFSVHVQKQGCLLSSLHGNHFQKKRCFHVNEQPRTEDANERTGPHPSPSRIFINRWSKLPNKWPMTPPTPFLTPLSALVIVILVSVTCGDLAAAVCSTFRYSVQIFPGVFKGDIGCPKW